MKKIDEYKAFLKNLDKEDLESEFFDRFLCTPQEYFVLSINAENKEKIIEVLVDKYDVALYQEPESNWTKEKTKTI